MGLGKVAILNEHKSWQGELCAKLHQAGIEFHQIPIQEYSFNINTDQFRDYDLVINRASPSAYLRENRAAVFFTLQLIEHFERLGIPVINGSRAYRLEISKASQYQLLERLGLPFPRTIVVNSAEMALRAVLDLSGPILLKPNVGGSAAGVTLCRERKDLTLSAADEVLKASPDGTALVQEFKDPDDETTYRVQMNGADHVYSLKAIGRDLMRCPNREDCRDSAAPDPDCEKQDVRFEAHQESSEVLEEVRRIVEEGGLDSCGVEYLISDGARYYFDINALSNIVHDPETKFKDHLDYDSDPTGGFVNFIKKRLAERRSASL